MTRTPKDTSELHGMKSKDPSDQNTRGKAKGKAKEFESGIVQRPLQCPECKKRHTFMVVALAVTLVVAFILVWGMGEVADWMVR